MPDPDYAAIIEEVLEVERQEAERQGDEPEEVDSKPGPPANDETIAKAEVARGRTFSDAYRAFLKTCDGWEYYAWGISLFGTEDLAGEAYEDAEETLSYSDDVPEELAKSLLIGKNENDATLVMLLDSGEVVDFLYEETERFADLASYLIDRKKTLLEMREAAGKAAARTEREWDPAFRTADDAALTEVLREVVSRAEPSPVPTDLVTLEDPETGPTAAPTDLVLKDEDGDITASVDLGLVLYLGAAPTKDETLETFRAFRRAFPAPGPLQWSLADSMVFSMNTSDDPDTEPFAEALRVDDQGYFGLRVQAGDDEAPYILNVRAIPPEDAYDEDEDEDEDDETDEGESGGVRRAAFVEVLVPPSEDPEKLRALCHALADILPIRGGHGGYFARVRDTRSEPDPWDTVFAWCRRYFGIDPCYVDGWLGGALTRHRGAGWLTALGGPFIDALGELSLGEAVTRHDGKHAIILTAGPATLGDVSRGGFPHAIAEVARALEPITLTTWTRRGLLSMGGVWFSTFADQLPGAFNHHHATESFMRRFVDPHAFVGPSAREEGLALIARLRESMDDAKVEAWSENCDLDDLVYFKDLLRALFNGAYHTPAEALRVEALEHAARFPDWAPPQTYNNLLHHYHAADRIDDAVALMPVALRTAKDNVHTYHNAACILVEAGRLDEAFDCVRRAKEGDYPHMDKLVSDDDLAPLVERDDWKALFGD